MKKIDNEHLIEQLQEEIKYCALCQPYDEGEIVWILGEESNLEELFESFEIPENIRDEIAKELRCPNCGYEFERYDKYGGKSNYERLIDKKYEEWHRKYDKKLDEFQSFIEKYPYLGAKHSLGKKIIDLMPNFPSKNIKDKLWFRARKISDGRKFLSEDMLAPDPQKVQIGEGRFNHFGQSHFYLAETDLGAAKELLAFSDEKMVWMQKVNIHNANLILNVSTDFFEPSPDPDSPLIIMGLIHFSNSLNLNVERDKYWKPEYFLSRFVSDAAKSAGFQGILYISNHHYSKNLVIFDISKIEYELRDDPYIFTLPDETNDIFTLPNENNDIFF